MKVLISLIMAVFLICNQVQAQNPDEHPIPSAELMRVYTDLPNKLGWWTAPKGVHKMTIFVEAKNTETVLFWLVPTGTQTWKERELLGYDKDGTDGWSLTWEFGNQALHHHILVQALGSDSATLSNDSINVATEIP